MTYIDTRDLADELDELEARRADEDAEPFTDEETERLDALRELAYEVGGDWRYGETMIPVEEFENYAQELADDIGAIDRDAHWPLNHIDWPAAAEELAQDYYVRAS